MSETSEGANAPRAWQRMLSGRRLDLLNPSPADIAIEDIAHGLARVARWNGQTIGEHALSVAQHSLIVTDITRATHTDWECRWLLAALLHDASEYVVGDLISPFKAAIGLDYKAFEIRLQGAIHERFGLPRTLPAEVTAAVKSADRIAAFHEATRLAGFAEEEARRFFCGGAVPTGLTIRIDELSAWPPALAQERFLMAFAALSVLSRPA